jgi:hypothetical protein
MGEFIIQTHKRNPTTYKTKWIVASCNYNHLRQKITEYDMNSLFMRKCDDKTWMGGGGDNGEWYVQYSSTLISLNNRSI